MKKSRTTRRIRYKKKGGFVYDSSNIKSNQRKSSIVLTRTSSNSRSNSSNKSSTRRSSGRGSGRSTMH